MEPVLVYVQADDPIIEAGVAGQLRPRREVRLVPAAERAAAAVVVVVADRVTAQVLRELRVGRRDGARLVLVVSDLDRADFATVVEVGIAGLVRRRDATPERLVKAIRSAAAGEGSVPPDLLGELLEQVRRIQRPGAVPRRMAFDGLQEREIRVLRLVAEGKDTAQIAAELAYSERTVKNVMHDITSRLNLHNRAHAVAYALRAGLL